MCEGPTCGVEFNELAARVTEDAITIHVGRRTFNNLLQQVPFRGHRRVSELNDAERALICAHLSGFLQAVNIIGGVTHA